MTATLQELPVQIIAADVCNSRDWFDGTLDERVMMCAGYVAGGKDACKGDTGGPLQCLLPDGRWRLIGVASWGLSCARPKNRTVYTRVDPMLEWIESYVQGMYTGWTKSFHPLNSTPCVNACIFTHADVSRGSIAVIHVCVYVCVSARTIEPKRIKLQSASRIVHHELSLILGQKFKNQGHWVTKYKRRFEGDRLAGVSLHSIEFPASSL